MVRNFGRTLAVRSHPELSLLKAEDTLIETVLSKLIKPGNQCLDIGAHIGSMSYSLGQKAGFENVKIVEAIPEKAKWLKERFGEEQVYEFAITTSVGEVEFYQNLKRPGFSSLSERGKKEEIKVIKVECASLDDLFGNILVDFIKIDVEGHEYDALKSGTNLLEHCKPIILFEAGAIKDVRNDRYDELFEFLTVDLKYEIFAVFELFHRNRPITINEFRLYRTYPFLAFNFVAITPETRSKMR